MTDRADLIARLRARAKVHADRVASFGWIDSLVYGDADAALDREAADVLSAPAVTEEMVRDGARGIRDYVASVEVKSRGEITPDPMDKSYELARACLVFALGETSLQKAQGSPGTTTIRPPEPTGPGPETYPGYTDPAAGLPGAEAACPICSRVLSMNRTLAVEFATAMGLAIEDPAREAAIRAEATAAERERCAGIADRYGHGAPIAAAIRGGRE